MESWSWMDVLVVKSTSLSSREPTFNSQYPQVAHYCNSSTRKRSLGTIWIWSFALGLLPTVTLLSSLIFSIVKIGLIFILSHVQMASNDTKASVLKLLSETSKEDQLCLTRVRVVPVTSVCFKRSKSPYLRVVLVVSDPATNKSVTVASKLSVVNSECGLFFSQEFLCDIQIVTIILNCNKYK